MSHSAKRRNRILILGDLLAIVISYAFALYCRYSLLEGNYYYPAVFKTDVVYRSFYLSTGIMQLVFCILYHLYRRTDPSQLSRCNPIERMREVIKRVAFLFFAMVAVLFATQQATFVSRSVVGIYFITLMITMIAVREWEYRRCRRNEASQKEQAYIVITDQRHLTAVAGHFSCPANCHIRDYAAVGDSKPISIFQYCCIEDLEQERLPIEAKDCNGYIFYFPQLGSEERCNLLKRLSPEGTIYWLEDDGMQFLRLEELAQSNRSLLVKTTGEKRTVSVLGVHYPVTNLSEAVAMVSHSLEQLAGKYICFSNVHTTMMAQDDPEYLQILNQSAYTFPDGTPIAKTQRKAGYEEAQRVAGPDFMEEMFLQTVGREKKHFFYGSTQETLDALKQNLKKYYLDLQIAGMYSPPFRDLTKEEDADIVRMIRDADADYIWIGLGAPKQEKWMAAHQNLFRGVMLGVGAGFDFHARTVQRAPKWIQTIGLEWFYRLLQDPKRLWKRYFVTNMKFLWYIVSGRQKKALSADSPIKVAMFGQKSITRTEGGVEVVARELATRLAARGMEVTCFDRSGHHVAGAEFDGEDVTEYQGVHIQKVYTAQKKGYAALTSSWVAAWRAALGDYDIVHFHAEGPSAVAWLPKIFGKKIVCQNHGLDYQRDKWNHSIAKHYLKYGEKISAKKSDVLLVLSPNIQQYFRDTYRKESILLPNGVCRPEKREADLIAKKWGLNKDSYFLFLARLCPEKGVADLIKAYREIETTKKLVIAGGSSDTDQFVRELKALAAGDERIIFTGFVQGLLLEELYSNAYVYCLPSELEGMPISLLEAMSYGNCCLVSDIPECLSVVEDHAVSFRAGDIKDLKAQITNLDRDVIKVQHYQQEAADYICGKYNWDRVTDQVEAIYKQLVYQKN